MQAFACDLDGTLVGRNGLLGPRTLSAIARSKDEGVRVLVATGRMFRSARRYLDEAYLAAKFAECFRELGDGGRAGDDHGTERGITTRPRRG